MLDRGSGGSPSKRGLTELQGFGMRFLMKIFASVSLITLR